MKNGFDDMWNSAPNFNRLLRAVPYTSPTTVDTANSAVYTITPRVYVWYIFHGFRWLAESLKTPFSLSIPYMLLSVP